MFKMAESYKTYKSIGNHRRIVVIVAVELTVVSVDDIVSCITVQLFD